MKKTVLHRLFAVLSAAAIAAMLNFGTAAAITDTYLNTETNLSRLHDDGFMKSSQTDDRKAHTVYYYPYGMTYAQFLRGGELRQFLEQAPHLDLSIRADALSDGDVRQRISEILGKPENKNILVQKQGDEIYVHIIDGTYDPDGTELLSDKLYAALSKEYALKTYRFVSRSYIGNPVVDLSYDLTHLTDTYLGGTNCAEMISAYLAEKYPDWTVKTHTDEANSRTYFEICPKNEADAEKILFIDYAKVINDVFMKYGYQCWPRTQALTIEYKQDAHGDAGVPDNIDNLRPVYKLYLADDPYIRKGDLDGDGDAAIRDAQLALVNYTEELSGNAAALTPAQQRAADVNADGRLTIEDAQFILRYYVENQIAGTNLTWAKLLNEQNGIQYVRTDWIEADYPVVSVIDTPDQLAGYMTNHMEDYGLSIAHYVDDNTTISFQEAAAKYTNEWFDTHKLLMVLVQEPSGSNRHQVTDISRDMVVIRRLEAQTGTCDMAAWHILIELDADTELSKEIIVQFETDEPVITETVRSTECADESGTNPAKETVTTANITS